MALVDFTVERRLTLAEVVVPHRVGSDATNSLAASFHMTPDRTSLSSICTPIPITVQTSDH